MDTITTDNFTKSLFSVLDLEWGPLADVRDLLSEILVNEEDIETIMEDSVFSLSQFLERTGNPNNLETYFTQCDLYGSSNNFLHIGNSIHSKMVFVIVVYDNSYILKRSLEAKSSEKFFCSNLDELKAALLDYFTIVHNQFKGTKK